MLLGTSRTLAQSHLTPARIAALAAAGTVRAFPALPRCILTAPSARTSLPLSVLSISKRHLSEASSTSDAAMPKPGSAGGSVRRGNRPSDQKTGAKGSPMTPIPSASLVVLAPVTRPFPQGKGEVTEYETVMLQRTARDGSSFRSAVVFPGGALDLADETPYLVDPSSGKRLTGPPQALVDAPPMTLGSDGERYMAALKLCALRETFEELGLLLVPSPGSSSEAGAAHVPVCRAIGHREAGMSKEEWASVRDEVHNDASLFPGFLRRIASVVADPYGRPPPPEHSSENSDGASAALPPLAPLAHHSNWITPRSVVRPAKRFDAHFFIAVLDEANVFKPSAPSAGADGKESKSVIDISADGTETTSLMVETPHELVQQAIDDRFVLFPPQFYILADLAAAMADGRQLSGVVPLNFQPGAPKQVLPVTAVEEEARGLQGRNYTWQKRLPHEKPSEKSPSIDWVSYKQPPFVQPPPGESNGQAAATPRIEGAENEALMLAATAIEPRPVPSAGANVSVPPKKTQSGEWERATDDEPFTFPLCLPGDREQSRDQAKVAGLVWKEKSSGGPQGPENRVFVSPRTKADGGGLVVRGIRRRGVADLRDFEYGVVVNHELVEDEEDAGRGKGAKL